MNMASASPPPSDDSSSLNSSSIDTTTNNRSSISPPSTRTTLSSTLRSRSKRLIDKSERSGRTMTTSNTSLMSSFNRSEPIEMNVLTRSVCQEEKEEILYDDNNSNNSNGGGQQQQQQQQPPQSQEGEFKPATIPGPARLNSKSNLTSDGQFAKEELNSSLTLPEVFKESHTSSNSNNSNSNYNSSSNITHYSGSLKNSNFSNHTGGTNSSSANSHQTQRVRNHQTATAHGSGSGSGSNHHPNSKNHNSSSSNGSEESSIFLDVSWGSNQFDKSLILSSFDDMLAAEVGTAGGGGSGGKRINAGRVGTGLRHAAAASASGNPFIVGHGTGTTTTTVQQHPSPSVGSSNHHTMSTLDHSNKSSSISLGKEFTTNNSSSHTGGGSSSNTNNKKEGGGGGLKQLSQLGNSLRSMTKKSSGSARSIRSNSEISDSNRTSNNPVHISDMTHLTNANEQHQHDAGNTEGSSEAPSMIPPVFKTIRRNSKSPHCNPQIVHVDGGGDEHTISNSLGFKNTNNNNNNSGGDNNGRGGKKITGILRKGNNSSRSRIRRSSNASSSSVSSASWTRGRRASDASNISTASDRLTGFQVLTASFQSARQQSLGAGRGNGNNNGGGTGLGGSPIIGGGMGGSGRSGDGTGIHVEGGPLGVSNSDRTTGSETARVVDRNMTVGELRNSSSQGSSRGRAAGYGARGQSLGGGGPSMRGADFSMMQDYKLEEGVSVTTPHSQQGGLSSSSSQRFVRGVSGSGGSIALSDSRRDETSLNRMDDSESRRDGQGGHENNQRRKSNDEDDDELVAEAVGGRAYLKASRSVWVMRFIVVFTFIVVSVIVTVLTYTFFRNMESGTVEHNFIEIATNLISRTSETLSTRAASTMALSSTITGILGSQIGVTPDNIVNHPPEVMLSPSTLLCAEGEDSNSWKTQWPNVTLPGFGSIASSMLGISHSQATVFAPILREDTGETAEWLEYAFKAALPPVKFTVSNGIRSSPLASEVVEDSMGGAHDNARHLNDLFGSSSSTLQIPAWQIAPAEMVEEGIMFDYYSHPPYKLAIDRLLNWSGKKDDEGDSHSGDHHGTRRRTMGALEEGRLQVAGTELIPCDDALLPLHLNPTPDFGSVKVSGFPQHEIQYHNHESIENDKPASSNNPEGGFCSAVFYPVYDSSSSNGAANISGVVAEMFSWGDLFANMIPGYGGHEVRVVVTSTLKLPDGSHRSRAGTYSVDDDGAVYIGPGDSIEHGHKEMMQSYNFSFPSDDVIYTFEVYPNDDLLCYKNGVSKQPMFLSIIAACFFFLSVLVFFVYDYFVNYRQKVVMQSAARSTRIVHSLYPQFVRDNLFREEDNRKEMGPPDATNTNSTQEYDEEGLTNSMMSSRAGAGGSSKRKGLKSKVSDFVDTPATQLKRFLTHPMPSRDYDYNLCMEIGEMEPIAEVFEKTTVMLADIEGFTAWCSEREPSQVFRLLETVYREFDIEAKKLGVFKVETVGDCYVAVTGLPDPRDDHAIVIAKYAVRCLLKFNVLTKRLEANLGPGTASLGMRFGLHSGPVTAGVLRGEKSRFQLFGDTINVASRMESTGEKNMIQVSQDTADLLNASGKGHWLTQREGPVSAKGKGSIQTYWLQPNRRRPSMHGSMRLSVSSDGHGSVVSEDSVPTVSLDRALRQSWKCIGIDNDSLIAKERLIRWNAAILESFLLKIVDNRNAHSPSDESSEKFIPSTEDKILSFSEKLSEHVMFPDVAYRDDYYGVSSDIAISSQAQVELLEYVARIASMYRDVPFHNFDHASHVTMSANKLLNRVCTTFEDEEEDISSVAARTYGISSDPLAQFVVVFSSLVHDVDHQGVPNAQLVKESDPLAAEFDNRSVAEKRSITIAWNILMEDRFRELQSLIFINGDEMRRFKQLLINTVLATDIADKERSAIAKARWQKAFHPSRSQGLDDSITSRLDDGRLRSLKATLVFEQIMQASDVAHTMQHWETFKKWNRRLYTELSKGYREGRGASDPRENWYGGEIGFFDFYIIPLAKKLKECGVFGSAASEYLDYALENRRRWEDEGKEIARKMIMQHDAKLEELSMSTAKEDVSKSDGGDPLDQHLPKEAAKDDPGELV